MTNDLVKAVMELKQFMRADWEDLPMATQVDEALAKAQALQPLTEAELDQIAVEDKGQGVFWYRGFLGKACERFAAKNGYTVKELKHG